MRWIRAAVLAAVVGVAAPRALPAQNPTTEESVRVPAVASSVAELSAALNAPDAAPASRFESARRLFVRQTPEAKNALRQAIISSGNVQTRIAAARVLADDPTPDIKLLPDLLALLTHENDRVVDAAAQAVASYKGNAQAVAGLIQAASATKQLSALRIPAIRALGQMVEQPAASALVRLMTTAAEPADVIAAAGDALVDMTGLTANGRDPSKWDIWQKQNGARPTAEWTADLVRARSAREDVLRRRVLDVVGDLRTQLEDQYKAPPAEDRPARLLRYLRGATPEMRQIGARLAYLVATQAAPGQNTPAIQERLLELVGDSDPGVRLNAVKTLYILNIDPERSSAALLPQLRVETDPDVKAAIQLSNVQRVEQVRDRRAQLDNPSPAVVIDAAKAIRDRAGAVLIQDPAAAAETSQKLRDVIVALAGKPEMTPARRASGEALAALKDPRNLDFAPRLLVPTEPPEIRAVGLQILGELGAKVTGKIVDYVDTERDPAVRIQGLQALAKTGSFDQSDRLVEKMNPRGNEPDAAVREAARKAYIDLLPSANAQKLAFEAPRRKNDPLLRIAVLQALVAKLKSEGRFEEAAFEQQNIGIEYLERVTPRQPDQAVPYLRDALDILRGKGQTVTARLVPQLLRAMLQSAQTNGQYAPLTMFANDLIKRATAEDAEFYKQRLGADIRNEADRLFGVREYDKTLALVDAALKIDPPLAKLFLDDLTKRRAEAVAARGAAK